jgi:exosortase
LLALLSALLWWPVLKALWGVWDGDKSLSHGPLVPLVTAGLLWARRDRLRNWSASVTGGMALLVGMTFLHLVAVWADVEFLKPLSLVGMIAGGVWFLGGWQALAVSAGALGFLVFMIPWPTTLVERIAFPLQLTSSAYAALLGGMFGLPIERSGVHLAVVPNPEAAPIYEVLVARQCSGLTSLMVLLALGYLIAYHTPVKLGWRALLVAAVPPIALCMNAIRLTLILMAGAYHGEHVAKWVHDNEAPVLIFFCSLVLMGLRAAILSWAKPVPSEASEPAQPGVSRAENSPQPASA